MVPSKRMQTCNYAQLKELLKEGVPPVLIASIDTFNEDLQSKQVPHLLSNEIFNCQELHTCDVVLGSVICMHYCMYQ